MLVVTRRPNMRIVFASLGITIRARKVPIVRDERQTAPEAAGREPDYGLADLLSRAA